MIGAAVGKLDHAFFSTPFFPETLSMIPDDDIHPNAPAGGGGPGRFVSALPTGMNSKMDKWFTPGPLIFEPQKTAAKRVTLTITVTVVSGEALSEATIIKVNDAAKTTPPQWRRGIAYKDDVKVGGSLAWRANNPGNLRDAATKIGTIAGAVGTFAVFASIEEGRAAQRSLYLSRYGSMKVKDAINKLTPPSENDTAGYLAKLEKAGVDLEKDVKSQIDVLMPAVEANEGLITGTVVKRIP